MFWFTIGSIAALLTSFGFVPQVIKMIRTRSVQDISLLGLCQFGIGVLLWVLYAIHIGDAIIIAANTVGLLIILTAIAVYFLYRNKGKKAK